MKTTHLFRAGRTVTMILVGLLLIILPFAQGFAAVSINSTSQNKAKQTVSVPQQPQVLGGVKGYQIFGANDLGMHCSDADYRIAAILPPYNTVHSQVIQIGTSSTNKPKILDNTTVDVYYSAASNPSDPLIPTTGSYTAPPGYQNPPSASYPIFKSNFWACKSGQASCLATETNGFAAYGPFYPATLQYPLGILEAFSQQPDIGLPTPDVERLFLGDGILTADQSKMPGQSNPLVANIPQKLSRFNHSYPVFKTFPFGYIANPLWFSAEGIPVSNWDDAGRFNAYPLVHLQAVPKGMSPTLSSNVLATLDTATPVSSEFNCRSCHTNSSSNPADPAFSNAPLGGNGVATAQMSAGTVSSAKNDPQFSTIPLAISVEYATDKNILALHDQREGLKYIDASGKSAPCDAAHPGNCLSNKTPVACQSCHYTPALDLAQVGPLGPGTNPTDLLQANGRQQGVNQSMSRVMHNFHAKFIPAMPPPNATTRSTTAQTQALLQQTCYTCHPGKITKCLRGVMASNNVVCQDCHGGMDKVGNDFSSTVSSTNPGSFDLTGSHRVPWANEPGCGSCHTGDALSNLTTHKNSSNLTNVIAAKDGINLAQAYFTDDPNAKPIVPGNDPLNAVGNHGNKRFAEPMVTTTSLGLQPMLYRFSTGHGGVFCQGCHGSTHAESGIGAANANDNVPFTQLQGHTGPITECTTCHKNDSGITLAGPHGMHPVGNSSFVNGGHHDYAESHLTECKACHGGNLLGTALSKAQKARSVAVEGRTVNIALGQKVACNICHEMPGN